MYLLLSMCLVHVNLVLNFSALMDQGSNNILAKAACLFPFHLQNADLCLGRQLSQPCLSIYAVKLTDIKIVKPNMQWYMLSKEKVNQME